MPRYQNPADINFYQGSPTPNGQLFFFESGTSTPKATYADVGESIQNPQPVLLDSAGREPNIFYSGSAKVVLKDEDSQQVWERDPVGGESVLGNFSDFNLQIIYSIHDTVQTSDGEFYKSLTSGNQGNDPLTTEGFWESFPDLSALAAIDTVIPQVGGGALTALRINELRDSDTYTLPLANSVDINQTITISLPDEFSANTPLVEIDGTDTITDKNGTDTSILFDSGGITITLTSDGAFDWGL